MDTKKEMIKLKKRIADLENKVQDLQKNKISLSELAENLETTFNNIPNYSSK